MFFPVWKRTWPKFKNPNTPCSLPSAPTPLKPDNEEERRKKKPTTSICNLPSLTYKFTRLKTLCGGSLHYIFKLPTHLRWYTSLTRTKKSFCLQCTRYLCSHKEKRKVFLLGVSKVAKQTIGPYIWNFPSHPRDFSALFLSSHLFSLLTHY